MKILKPRSLPFLHWKRFLHISELSTFTAVYNGITKVMNKEKPEEIDYYISYEARVDAGIDFEKIVISVGNDTKIINMTIPEDFIFFNK